MCKIKTLGIITFVFLLTLAPKITTAQNFNLLEDVKISNDSGNFTATLDNADLFGYSSASLGDLDGDGIEDVAIGSLYDDDGGTDRGAVHILFLNSNGSVKSYTKIANNTGGFTGTLDNSDLFGSSIANIGDINGDGVTDIAVGAMYDDDGGTNKGAVWILFLDTNGTVKSFQKISDTQGGFTGTMISAGWFGVSIACLGDLNNDGINDIAVGAVGEVNGATRKGAVWVLFLDTNGTVKSHQLIHSSSGNFTGQLDYADRFGASLANIGDINNDGITDIAVGTYYDDDGGTDRGAVWILFLDTNGTVKGHQKISDTQGGFTGTLDNLDVFGMTVTSLGDFNDDGIPDILVGAALDDDGGTDRGALWLLYLNTDGTVKLTDKISDTLTAFSGNLSNGDRFGQSVTKLTNLNASRELKILTGAAWDDDGGTDRGAVYILTLLQNFPNNIFINTISFSDSITYELEFQGESELFTTKSVATMLINNVDTTYTAKITVEATDSFGALTLLFDVNEVNISNVRVITDSLGGGDTLALDSNLYKISTNGQTLTLYQRDTSEIAADSLLFGFVLQGGLGFSPDNDGVYDELMISGLENINQFELTIKDLSNNVVFTTTDKSEFWNGKYMGSGSLVSVGTYNYIMEVNGDTLEGQILLDY